MSNAGKWSIQWKKELDLLEKDWKKENPAFDAKMTLGNFQKIAKPLKNLDAFVTSLSMAKKDDQPNYIKPLGKHVQDVVVPLKKALKPLQTAAQKDPAKAKIKKPHSRFEKFAIDVIDEAEFEVKRLIAAEKRMTIDQAARAKSLGKAQKQGDKVMQAVEKLGEVSTKSNSYETFNKNLKQSVAFTANWAKQVVALIPNKKDAAKLERLRQDYIKSNMPRMLKYDISEDDLKSQVEDLKAESKELITKGQAFKNG